MNINDRTNKKSYTPLPPPVNKCFYKNILIGPILIESLLIEPLKASLDKHYIKLLFAAISIFFLAACDPLNPAVESLYMVDFDLSGINSAVPEIQIVREGELAERPHVKIDDRGKLGKFVVIEWYKDKDFNGPAFQFGSIPITASFRLYARWVDKFKTVTFEPSYPGAKSFFRYVGKGKTLGQSVDDPLRENFAFIDWVRDKAAPVGFDFANTPIETNITLYAGWRSGYVFSFNGREYNAHLYDDNTFLLNVGKTYTRINDQKVQLLKVPFGFTTEPAEGAEIQLTKSWGAFEANEDGQKIDYKLKVFVEPTIKTELKAIVDDAIATEGDNVNLNFVETHRIKDMSKIFYGATTFNGDVSAWNTSNVTDMDSMFSLARTFNGDISAWNTGQVTIMKNMFAAGSNFNGDLSGWNTSNVTDVRGMFSSARAFNGNISTWDTSSVENMDSMFDYAEVFNRDLSGWNTSNVTNMRGVFRHAAVFNGDISTWNTSNVRDMSKMFEDTAVFNRDISGWNTGNVTNMSEMFHGTATFNQDISGWDVANVTNARDFISSTSGLLKYPTHIPKFQ